MVRKMEDIKVGYRRWDDFKKLRKKFLPAEVLKNTRLPRNFDSVMNEEEKPKKASWLL